MCMQCMAGAMTAVGAASGVRAWLAAWGLSWLTPARLRAVTVVLMVSALVASAVLVGASGSGSGSPRVDRPSVADAGR